MQFNYNLYTILLLADKQNDCLSSSAYEPGRLSNLSLKIKSKKIKLKINGITKKTGYLSLLALLTNSVLAIAAGDIKNTPFLQHPSVTQLVCPAGPTTEMVPRCINFARALTSRTFDYDAGLLPDVAEVIFALRIKHANIDKPFFINLSGNYLLKFTKDRIYVLDTYTKNSDVYEYQSANPNITIGLGISKGLADNYKSIIIKEDANGQLYDYAALRSDNISTDETMLNETLNHPFYEIAGKDGVEDEVTVSKAMAFYQKILTHERYARCVKSNMRLVDLFQEILTSDNTVCRPEPDANIHNANHQSVKDMKLDQQLVEATIDKGKYKYALGYRLEKKVDFGDKNTVALLASSDFCKINIITRLKTRRRRRDLSCLDWATKLVDLYISLSLNYTNLHQVVQSAVHDHSIPASLFPHGQYPANSEADRERLVLIIASHSDEAEDVLQRAAGLTGMAAMADLSYSTSLSESTSISSPTDDEDNSLSADDLQRAVTNALLEYFTLDQEELRPVPGEISRLNHNLQPEVLSGQHYSTRVFPLGSQYGEMWLRSVAPYLTVINNWISQAEQMIQSAHGQDRVQLELSLNVLNSIHSFISGFPSPEDLPNLVVSAVSHRVLDPNTLFRENVLIGISIGEIRERVYHPLFSVMAPEFTLRREGTYIGALEYLRSQVLRNLFSLAQIDSSEVEILSRHRTNIHDEL